MKRVARFRQSARSRLTERLDAPHRARKPRYVMAQDEIAPLVRVILDE